MKQKMKKHLLFIVIILIAGFAFAYNPPAGAQNLFNLSGPSQLGSANSSAGQGIFMPSPGSIAFNPALTSMEQRIQLDAAYSGLISTNQNDKSHYSSALQAGILVPTKFFTITGFVNGIFSNFVDMNLANSANFKVGFSKEIAENFSLGLNLNYGLLWGAGEDWAIGADLGVLYRVEQMGFLKDFRLGFSALNLGKYYSPLVIGLDSSSKATSFPSPFTLKVGVASLLFQTSQFKGGFSFDVSVPSFQNLVLDAGLQFGIKDIVFVSIAEQLDVVEVSHGSYNFMPAVTLGVKFDFNTKKSEYLKKHEWDSSEMLTSLAWQQKYENIQVISAGARLFLGQQDTSAPVIQLWEE